MFGENAIGRAAADAVRPHPSGLAAGQRVIIHCGALLARAHPKFFEMPETQTADDGLLNGRDVGIDLVSTERRAHHRPSRATALRLVDELGDGLGNVVRLRSVLS